MNEQEVEELMKRAGIKCVDLSELSIIEQLLYCSKTKSVVSQHGAQLINAMSTEGKILEVLPIPYCLEGWGQTMMRMAGYMELEYNCLLAPSDTWRNYTIREMRKKYKEERNLAKWQSDQFQNQYKKFYQKRIETIL